MFLGIIEWFHNGSPLKINSLNGNRIDYRNGTLTIDQTSVKHFISQFLIFFFFLYICNRLLIRVSINVYFEVGNGTRLESFHSVNILSKKDIH